MSTLVSEVTVTESTTRDRRQLVTKRGTYGEIGNFDLSRHTLEYQDAVTLQFTQFVFMYFPKPTLITLTVNSNSVDLTVVGTLVLPAAGSVHVEHTDAQVTDPIVFEYLKA